MCILLNWDVYKRIKFSQKISSTSVITICMLLSMPHHGICILTGKDATNGQPSESNSQFYHQQVSKIVQVRNISSERATAQDSIGQSSEFIPSPRDISKRNTALNNGYGNSRSYIYPGGGGGYGNQGEPFCYDRYVKGTCRYRTDPSDCFSYEWTAYATIDIRGVSNLYSIPSGLYLPESNNGVQQRVRVFLKVSCCTPVVQFYSTGTWGSQENSCVVDVRELQALHPGEIAGIVIGVIALLIIIIVIIVLVVRKRRRDQMPILVGRAHIGPASRERDRDREQTSRQ